MDRHISSLLAGGPGDLEYESELLKREEERELAETLNDPKRLKRMIEGMITEHALGDGVEVAKARIQELTGNLVITLSRDMDKNSSDEVRRLHEKCEKMMRLLRIVYNEERGRCLVCGCAPHIDCELEDLMK
jgi:hypothetical protein